MPRKYRPAPSRMPQPRSHSPAFGSPRCGSPRKMPKASLPMAAPCDHQGAQKEGKEGAAGHTVPLWLSAVIGGACRGAETVHDESEERSNVAVASQACCILKSRQLAVPPAWRESCDGLSLRLPRHACRCWL